MALTLTANVRASASLIIAIALGMALFSPPNASAQSATPESLSVAVIGVNVTIWPAIVVISLLWAGLHVQYDWTGILQIFVIGLFLGWTRWRSGSTLLTFLLHALFNLEGTIETVLQMQFFS